MGSFPGHVLPGTLFFVVGMWHIWCSIVRYVSNPKSFQVRVWNPVPGFEGRFKYLELYIIAIGGFIDLCIEFLYSTHLKIFVNGVLNPSHMNNFEHSGMLLMFFIFGVITLLSGKKSYLPLPKGALCFIASAAFIAEYLLFYFHSTTHKGLEGYYHFILVVLIGLCILSTIAGALMPASFPMDLCSGISIALQGLWFYQTAFTLYGSMMPEGCHLKESEIECHSTEHEIRGKCLQISSYSCWSLEFLSLFRGRVSITSKDFAIRISRMQKNNGKYVRRDFICVVLVFSQLISERDDHR